MSKGLRVGSLLVLCTVACVRIPASIKQEFRAAEPDERSNYQPGLHGTAPPVDASDPWSRWGAERSFDAGAPTAEAGTLQPIPSAAASAPAAAAAVDGGTP